MSTKGQCFVFETLPFSFPLQTVFVICPKLSSDKANEIVFCICGSAYCWF
jgi:hypothetical protein